LVHSYENRVIHRLLLQVTAIATILQKSPVVYFSLKESGIETPFDFIGKRVGIREGTGVWYTYLSMMNNLGIDRTQITEVPVSFGVSPLLEGEADVLPGFRTNEPKLVEKEGREVNLIKPEDYGVDIYSDVLVTTNQMIEDNPELVEAFVRATLKGWEYSVNNQEKTVDAVMMYVDTEKTTQEFQSDMLGEFIPLVKPAPGTKIGQMNFTKWNRTYTLLREFDVITVDIDVNDAYTTQFLK